MKQFFHLTSLEPPQKSEIFTKSGARKRRAKPQGKQQVLHL